MLHRCIMIFWEAIHDKLIGQRVWKIIIISTNKYCNAGGITILISCPLIGMSTWTGHWFQKLFWDPFWSLKKNENLQNAKGIMYTIDLSWIQNNHQLWPTSINNRSAALDGRKLMNISDTFTHPRFVTCFTRAISLIVTKYFVSQRLG